MENRRWSANTSPTPVGVLLAAGLGLRFDSSGVVSKLLAELPNGNAVAIEAARRMLHAVPRVIAVVRPGQDALAYALAQTGCVIARAGDAFRGMGASLAAGVAASFDASGWIVALADMPAIEPATILAVSRAVADGASLVAPFYEGRRGHPVGLGARNRSALLALDGDVGPRTLFSTQEFVRLDVDDPGILYDIDVPSDLGGGMN
jgi:molybdenum cofactor cytidylyltransferase